MKKKCLLIIYIGFLILILAGCSERQEQIVSLEVWHYYNGAQKIAFDQLVVEFNETLGLEKGIILEAFSQSDIKQLEEKIIESADEKVGVSEMPHMITTYPEIAYTLDQKGVVANLEEYLTREEINEYVNSYVEEGRLGQDNQFKIFPTAKATEVMLVNKTDWDKFAKATGATTKDLETWEGIRRTGELYYHWTDSLTDKENDGKAFFGRDALANYILVGSKQLGKEIFQVQEGKATLDIDPNVIARLWDNYYIPYISGYYVSHGRFSSDDAKTGEIIALVGSTTGVTYFPDNVTIGDNDCYDIELLVLPLPNFENTDNHGVQQGAGIAVLKSDQAHEEAAVEFLKWFTEDDRNIGFSIATGYLPVRKSAYHLERFAKKVEKEAQEGLSKSLKTTVSLALEQVGNYELHVTKGFKNSREAREILENSLKNKAKSDREKVINLMDQGVTHEEAVKTFATEENFKQWLLGFEKSLAGVIEHEK